MSLCRALLALWASVTATSLTYVELLQLALEVVGCKTLERPQLGLQVRGRSRGVGRGLGCGAVWRLHEYKGANEANILPSTHTPSKTQGVGSTGESEHRG